MLKLLFTTLENNVDNSHYISINCRNKAAILAWKDDNLSQ